mmetsp:Transcript_32788/g.82938  ORF Transcript_32788/g.82938 Transcript_32788/m.82938 type:complete len:232 (-) Transcript_32788:157-852(-)
MAKRVQLHGRFGQVMRSAATDNYASNPRRRLSASRHSSALLTQLNLMSNFSVLLLSKSLHFTIISSGPPVSEIETLVMPKRLKDPFGASLLTKALSLAQYAKIPLRHLFTKSVLSRSGECSSAGSTAMYRSLAPPLKNPPCTGYFVQGPLRTADKFSISSAFSCMGSLCLASSFMGSLCFLMSIRPAMLAKCSLEAFGLTVAESIESPAVKASSSLGMRRSTALSSYLWPL